MKIKVTTKIYCMAEIELSEDGAKKFNEIGYDASKKLIKESFAEEVSELLDEADESSLEVEIEVLDE